MWDWNVVVTVYDERGFRLAKRLMSDFGRVDTTDYFNVLVMKVADVAAFTEAVCRLVEESPGYLNDISRIVPAHATFDYASPEDFAEKAEKVILGWADRLADKSFYIRLHRRGFRGRILSPEAERALDTALLERLGEAGHPGRVSFEDPDMVIDIETVGNRAGLSLWTRDELARFPFLHVD
ncbi:MAG: THUMP domain-containing protein [Hyphomicrobiales bacterium]|nr:THUMP domain-containing protein [Hyphomicrobiales bacterium]